MRRLLAASLVVTVSAALPAIARQSVADCEAVWKIVTSAMGEDMAPSMPVRPSVTSDGCVVRDVEADQGSDYGMRFKIRSITFSGTRLDQLAEGLPPTALALKVDGLRMVPNSGDAGFEYLLQSQQGRDNAIDFVLRAHWDEATKTIFVDQFDVDYPGDNSTKLNAELTGIDLSTQDAMMLSLGNLALTKFDAEIVSNGLFESYLLMPLGSSMFYGVENPEALVETQRKAVLAGLDQMPETILPVASRRALQQLIGELPNPAGTLMLKMTADPGLGAGSFTRAAVAGPPGSAAEVASYFEGATFDITYTPTPQE